MRSILITGVLLIGPLIATDINGSYAKTISTIEVPEQIAAADVLAKETESERSMKSKSVGVSSLQDLLGQKNYFGLRDALMQNKAALDKRTYLFYYAFVENAFLHPEKSNEAINTLFAEWKSELTDAMVAKLLLVKEDNHVKMFQYKHAGETAESLVKSYAHVLDSAQMADEENNMKIWVPLSNIPGQSVKIRGTTRLPLSKDKAGLWNVPVNLQGRACDFIFDTGADLCVLRKGYAEKLKLRKIESSISVKGSTGKDNLSELAVADSIKIGEITVRNVVFLVLPDEKLTFPQINYEINGIIGFPIMQQLKELRFSKDGTLTIPKTAVKSKLRNLALCGSKSIVNLAAGTSDIYCLLDTGANSTELYKKYYCEHKNEVEENGVPDSLKYSALGETKTRKIYRMKEFSLSAGGNSAILPSIDVYMDDLRQDRKMFYGSIGQDYIGLFNEMIINYESMYFKFD